MRLNDLIKDIPVKSIKNGIKEDPEITALVYDSRKIVEGCLFVCIKGIRFDGHDKIAEASDKKAAAVLCEYIPDGMDTGDMNVVLTEDTRYALGVASAAWFGHPAEKLKTIGITGTKGKTTSAYMVKNILENAGIKTGLIGTIEIDTGKRHISSVNTTPESYAVQEYLAEMAENGCSAAVMEVSSQGLMQHRTAGFVFDLGIFTNLSPDHVGPGEHKDFEDYKNCKKKLFKSCKTGIFNRDDAYYKEMIKDASCLIETFGRGDMEGGNRGSDMAAKDMVFTEDAGALGVRFKISGKKTLDAYVDLPGSFSVYNALAAVSVCSHFGVSDEAILKALREVKVRGRIEMLPVSDDYTFMIDYAHNAMALESLLRTLKEYEPGRLVTVFGCGGNRSRDRRFDMGEVSGRLSDLTVITSDNPRDEEPLDIIKDIETGIKKTDGEYVTVPDRKDAIAWSIDHARKGDVIVLAGKGHEDYQEIKGVKYPMDERELVREVLKERGRAVRF